MFKKFVQEIVDAKTYDDLLDIFYRADGIDMSFQRGKINWKDHQTLFNLIEKIGASM